MHSSREFVRGGIFKEEFSIAKLIEEKAPPFKASLKALAVNEFLYI